MSEQERQPTDWQEVQDFVDTVIKPQNVSDRVISAFEQVDRAEFVPLELNIPRGIIYSDRIIRLGKNSSISQPSFVAKMLNLMEIKDTERVFEVGTGTGYQAGLESQLAESVDTVELDPRLAEQARENLERAGIKNVTVHEGDGAEGLPEAEKFDAIVFTAHVKEIPPEIIDQLAMEGRIVAPVGLNSYDSILRRYIKKSEGKPKFEAHGSCNFVPLFSEQQGGWIEQEWLDKSQAVKRKERFPRKVSLKNFWTDQGQNYEEMIWIAQQHLKDITGNEEPMSEDEIVDIIFLSRNLTAEAEKD